MSSAVTEEEVALDDGPAKEREYWLGKLAVERRPCGPRPDHRRGEGRFEKSARVAFEIAGDLYERLQKLTGGEPFLEHATLTAALTACLYRYTHESPVVVGCPPMRAEGEAVDPHNAIVLVNDAEGQMTFRQLLMGVRRTLLEAHEHQGYPYGQLLEDLGLPATPNRCPLFDVAVVHRELHYGMPGLSHDLALTWTREARGIEGAVAYSPGLYEAATIERFGRHLLNLLRHGLEDTSVALADLGMLTGEERRQVAAWNDTAHDYPRDRSVHELFEEQVERAPDSTALVFGDHRLSHRELAERANRLAHHLQKLGVVANAPVGIFLDRSAELVVAMLAVLKAGGAYVPYDPTYPRERIAAMFDDMKLKVLLTRESFLERLPEHKPRVICLDRNWGAIAGQPADKPQPRSGPGDLSYIIFTSGSTGRPKAPAVYHRGWTNLLWWFASEFAITPRDRTLVMSSISFDLTQRAIAMPLVTGGELHLAPDGYDPELILRTFREQQITLMNCAPSTFYPLLEGSEAGSYTSLASLRCLFLGGEAISASRLKRWATAQAGTTEIANVYGAAESSDVTSFYRLHDFDRYISTSVPIGRPIYNSQIYVVDEELRLVPIGAGGEICLGGDGVGRGYINDPALTSRKFVDDPFAAQAGARLYRTGDLGRYLFNGDLEFMGRVDHQVKIRGLRIELGEIETLLRAQDGVTEAVAVAAEYSPGDRRLTAYYVSSRPDGAEEQLETELRQALAQKLPASVIPNVFVRLAEMPLNPNGKIDRGALPLPVLRERRSGAAAVPRNPTEQAVAGLFAEILNVEEVGFSDDFFRLGGHSLMATQMIARISEIFAVRFTAVDFFARPTVAALAERVEAIRQGAQAESGPSPAVPPSSEGALPQ